MPDNKPKDLEALVADLYPHKDISLKPEAMVAYCEHMGITEPDLSDLESASDAFYGEYKSDADFASEFADGIGLFAGLPQWGRNSRDTHPCELYFNWDCYARDLMYDYFEANGFYFHSH
jgi:antirestriction protein